MKNCMAYLRDEFESNCGINRNVSTNAESHEGCENEECGVVVRTSQPKPKGRRD